MPVYQTNALEFSVTRRLGGTQRNDLFSVDEQDSDDYAPPDDQNIRHFTVDDLGVVDLSLVPGSTTVGMRFVPWIWLSVPVAAAPGLCQVVDAETLRVMRDVFAATATREYFNRGIALPQGAALKFGDWTALPGRPIRLRISVVPPTNTLQWAQMRQAFCCLNRGSVLFEEPEV
jgi:hypothetical protein